jgi:hypothetical protein
MTTGRQELTAWDRTRATRSRTVVESVSTALAIHTAVGSFDSVRLAPHSAQDDKSEIYNLKSKI